MVVISIIALILYYYLEMDSELETNKHSVNISEYGGVENRNVSKGGSSGSSGSYLECDTNARDWGSINAGTSKSKDIQIRFVGNSPVTLSLRIENWQPPEAKSYLTLSWNYINNTLLQPNI